MVRPEEEGEEEEDGEVGPEEGEEEDGEVGPEEGGEEDGEEDNGEERGPGEVEREEDEERLLGLPSAARVVGSFLKCRTLKKT